MKDLFKVVDELIKFRQSFTESKKIDSQILKEINTFFWASVADNFFTNLTQDNVKELNLPKGKINLIKSEYKKTRKLIKKALKGDSVTYLRADYLLLKKSLRDKFPEFLIISKEVEKKIDIVKIPKDLKEHYNSKKKIADKTNFDAFFMTLAMDAFIEKKQVLPKTNVELNNLTKLLKPHVIQSMAGGIYDSLRKNMPELIKGLSEDQEKFNQRLYKTWKEPFDLLRALIHASWEIVYIHREYCENKITKDNKFVHEAMIQIHARALRISNEILALLKNGYPDGAHARWRSLYELAVISYYISSHDNEVAQRYLEHHIIDKYNQAMSYQNYHKRLKHPPIKRELNKLIRIKNKLCQKYGNYYVNDYGWIPKKYWNGRDGVGFGFLEKEVGIDHLNPFYKWACTHLHGGAGGLYSTGLMDDYMLLIGSSNYGLADPLQNTAISLHQITVNYLNLIPNMEGVLSMFSMQFFIDQIGKSAVTVQKKIESDEEKINSNLSKK